MQDWAKLAVARGLPLTALELNRITAPLESLEQAFRPLMRQLTPDLEPDVELHLEGERE